MDTGTQLSNQIPNKNLDNTKDALIDEIWAILRCPCCGGKLAKTTSGAQCLKCKDQYPLSVNNQLDLRLRRKKKYSMAFNLDVKTLPDYDKVLQRLPINPLLKTGCSCKGSGCISPELLSYFPKSLFCIACLALSSWTVLA